MLEPALTKVPSLGFTRAFTLAGCLRDLARKLRQPERPLPAKAEPAAPGPQGSQGLGWPSPSLLSSRGIASPPARATAAGRSRWDTTESGDTSSGSAKPKVLAPTA